MSSRIIISIFLIFFALPCAPALMADLPLPSPGVHHDLSNPEQSRAYCVIERVDGGFETRGAGPLPPAAGGRVAGELWRDEDWDGSYGAIAEDVAISANGLFILAAWNLNYERISLYGIESDTPVWEFDFTGGGGYVGGSVYVDISADGGEKVGGVSGFEPPGTRGVSISQAYLFTTSATPEWTFELPTTPVSFQLADVSISEDGSTVGVLGVDSGYTMGKVWVLDAANGAGNEEWDFDYTVSSSAYNVAFTADGSRLAVGCRKLIHVYDAPGGLLQTITLDYDCQCPAAISRGGEHIAVGNLHGRLTLYEYQEPPLPGSAGGPYTELWHYDIPPDYYYPWIQTVALSGNDNRVVAGSYQPNQTDNHGYLYIFDLDDSEPVWVSDDSGDLVEGVGCSATGQVAVAGSWGDYDGVEGWGYKIARDSGDRYTVSSTDYQGSFFTAGVDDNGYFATGGTKRVHAREMGSGGHVFAFTSGVKVETLLVEMDCIPASGTVPFGTDIHIWITNFTNGPRDFYGHVDAQIASGMLIENLESGSASAGSGQVFHISWRQKIPDIPSVIGDNRFLLTVEDITVAPYNQPPYLPAGDKDADDCIVTAIYQP